MLRLLTYNIRYGGTGHEAQLAAAIRASEAELVVLQEATDPRVVARLASETGLAQYGSRPRYSMGFLSRVKILDHLWHPVRARHPFLELVVADHELRIFGLHLSAWFSNWSERRRAREIRALLAGIREHQHGFHLIVGDFNALAPGERLEVARMPRWIRAMVWLSGRDIARHTIQHMLDASYVDAWRKLHPTGEGYTFPTWDPHVRLDYAFVPAPFASRVLTCEVFTDPPA